MLKLKRLMKQTQYNFFPELYNLYGPFFKGTYASDIIVQPKIII